MALYVALDGGGTKTQCCIADDERVLGQARTGSVKLMRVDEATATARLHQLLADAAAAAGISQRDVTATCFGLAGSSSARVQAWAREALAAVVTGKIEICGDDAIALDAAFHGGPGVLVIAGTGSNVIGRCANGGILSAGGWGPMIGDEGSGHWIGVEAIKAGLRAEDRGVSTCLLAEIQHRWGLQDRAELVAHANARPRPDYAALAEVVAGCADTGDALAQSVLERAGRELADQVSLVASKMHAAGCASTDARSVAFTGSMLEKIPLVRRSLEEALHAAAPGMQLAASAIDPLEGALWRARQMARTT